MARARPGAAGAGRAIAAAAMSRGSAGRRSHRRGETRLAVRRIFLEELLDRHAGFARHESPAFVRAELRRPRFAREKDEAEARQRRSRQQCAPGRNSG